MEDGRYFLPGSATGHRETIVTSPLRAEPQYLQIMPGPSVWPFLAAIFTAGFFILLTIQAYGVGVASGILAIACVLRWLWETDRPVADEQADIGAGIRVPTYVTGPSTPRLVGDDRADHRDRNDLPDGRVQLPLPLRHQPRRLGVAARFALAPADPWRLRRGDRARGACPLDAG